MGWMIRNHETGKSMALSRDVCTRHPDWVHEQMGSNSESELQDAISQYSEASFDGGPSDEDDSGVWLDV